MTATSDDRAEPPALPEAPAAEAPTLDLGRRLRAERLGQGMGLREMARRLGISASALSQIETGKAQPSVSKLFDIVNLLGVSVDGLLAGFLHVEYRPGACSSVDGTFMRHAGQEFGYLLSGRLRVDVGFDSHRLGPGDSISFPATTPHRLRNDGPDPAHAIWCILGRHAT